MNTDVGERGTIMDKQKGEPSDNLVICYISK